MEGTEKNLTKRSIKEYMKELANLGKGKDFYEATELETIERLEYESIEKSKIMREGQRVQVELQQKYSATNSGLNDLKNNNTTKILSAVIKYIGPTKLLDWYHGVWIGLELDEPGKKK
jgi:hypothetical protein